MPSISAHTRDWPRVERPLLLAVTILFLLGAAWMLVRFVGLFLDDSWELAQVPHVFDPAGKKAVAAPSLADYHLFGAAPGQIDGDVVLESAPETDLDLVLRGTLATDDQDQALAIIADGRGGEQTYGVGDELPGSARLYRVYEDRVLLRTDEGVEALSLRPPDGSPPERRAADTRTGVGRLNVVQPRTSTDWAALRSAMLADPARIAKNVSALPVQIDGELVGFRLRPGRDAALLTQLGLRQSDVITAVNGIELNDYSKAADVLTELKTASTLRVTVLRNGQQQQLTIPLNQ